MSGFFNLPVVTTGAGPLPPSGTTSGAGNQDAPTDADSYEFWTQFYDALEVKSRHLGGCNAEFPQPTPYYGLGTANGVEVTTDEYGGETRLTFSFNDVGWEVPEGCSGTKWAIECGACLNYIPEQYDIVFIADYDDAYTWIRFTIESNTYDSGSNTGTITVSKQPADNAVTANFISSYDDLATAQYRIIRSGTGQTSRDRRPLKPNQRECWRGTIDNGWIDSSGNGQIFELRNTIDPSPYDTDGGPLPLISWSNDLWKAGEYATYQIRFFDDDGYLQSKTIDGNDSNTLGWGSQNYKLTVTASSGTFELQANGESCTPAFDATASTIQTALNALTGISGATVSGSSPDFVVTFAATPFVSLAAVDGCTVAMPDDATAISGDYIICHEGDKGMPGRTPDPFFAAYRGVKQSLITHMPNDSQGSVGKGAYSIDWQEGSPCAGGDCIDVSHNTLFVDAQIEIDNECRPGDAGDFVAPDYHKCIAALQNDCLGLLGSFIDYQNPFGTGPGNTQGPNYLTPATWAVQYASLADAWSTSLSVATGTGVGNVGAPPFTVQNYPLPVYYTLQDSHQQNVSSGVSSVDSSGVIAGTWSDDQNGLTIFLWSGFTRTYRRRHKYNYPKMQWMPDCGINPTTDEDECFDPPAITPGGSLPNPNPPTLALSQGGTLNYGTTYSYVITAVNASGETLPSSEASIYTNITLGSSSSGGSTVTITTNTYSIILTWTLQVGASSYNVYGRNGGGEVLLANVSAYAGTWTDDGSISMSGGASPPTSNTTATNCFGTGYFIARDISPSHLSVTGDGIVNDGGPAFVTNVLSRYVGDNAGDPFSGRGAISNAIDDASYWDRLFRGKYHKALEIQRHSHQNGGVTYGTKYSLFDSTADWSVDGLNNGILRIQAGLLTGGGSTTVEDSDYNNVETSKSCWFNPQRFLGGMNGTSATPYSYFILEIYAGGMLAGWSYGEDGTASYTAPTATGHSGALSSTATPTVSGITPTPLIHATGYAQPIFIQGNNFQSGCYVTFTAPDASTFTVHPSTTTAGELTLSVLFTRDSYGDWSFTVNNPGGASDAFDFTVKQVQTVPVASFSAGTFTLNNTLAASAASGDGYLIREWRYEQNRHAGRVVVFTADDGTQTQAVCRYSDKDQLFFDSQSDAIEGSYQIKEIPTGATLLLSTSKPTVASGLLWCEAPADGSTKRYWIQPSGTDSRGSTFVDNIYGNLETKVVDYGFAQLLDDVSPTIPNEMYLMIKAMTTTTAPVSWHNYDCSGSPPGENNYNGREGGAGDDLDYGTAAGLWSQMCPDVHDIGSPCAPGSTSGESRSFAIDCSGLDDTPPYGDVYSSIATGGYQGCASNYSCCDIPSPQPLFNVTVAGSWIYAYGHVDNIDTCYSSTTNIWCFSPALPDGDWDLAAACTCHCTDCYACNGDTNEDGSGCVGDCNPDYTDYGCYPNTFHVHKDGEDLWIGGSVGLSYNSWANMGGGSGGPSVCTGKIGTQPTPVDPASIAGSYLVACSIGNGYSITNYIALVTWEDDYD